jgi:hypothetical protein
MYVASYFRRAESSAMWTKFNTFNVGLQQPRPPLLTPWSTVLLEKLSGVQLAKKFPEFYGTQRFITAFTNARNLSTFWVSSTQSLPPTSHFPKIRLNILQYMPGCLMRSLSLSFLSKNLHTILLSSHTCYKPRLSHSRFYHPNNIGWGVQIIKLLIM